MTAPLSDDQRDRLEALCQTESDSEFLDSIAPVVAAMLAEARAEGARGSEA